MKDRSEAQQGQKFHPDMVSDDAIKDAIIKAKGYVTRAAKKLKRSPDMIYQRMASSPELRAVLAAVREERLDNAESRLDARINRGDVRAICYYLDAQGRRRGYGRQLVEDPEPQEKSIESLTDDELRLRAEEVRRRIASTGRGAVDSIGAG